ncbi:MAG: ABC transporter ATP-binding protein [Fibrobacteres bacterium]|nr:ABC transporter ATP-binding protein [Fibrobacterota bacterium]
MSPRAKLAIEGLSKSFPGGVKALDGFSLAVGERELVTVVGPSGCGKSTLLRLIAGLEEPDAGTVVLEGKALDGLPPRERDMAIMFQNYTLFPHMTVAENMAFGLKLRGTPKVEIDKRVRETAALLGIEGLLGRYPGEMSGGQRQRAALGRAILRKPKVYLFDEPLSNLDAMMRAQLRVEIARLHLESEAAMLFVTHDQVEAMTLGDRVVVLRDGVIQQCADPDTLYRFPANAFTASFIGTPGMNLFRGALGESGGEPAFIHPLFSFPLDPARKRDLAKHAGKPIVFGLRPEDIGSEEARSGSFPRIAARIAVAERLGGQVCLYLEGGGGEAFAARPKDTAGCRPGDRLELALGLARGRFFDAESGAALDPSA